MPPAAERDFLSCDWGTSHFRLKWIVQGKIVNAFQDENGCKRLHHAALSASKPRSQLFEEHLLSAIDKVVTRDPFPSDPLPLLISGMASSTIGWKELPYAFAPIRLDGSMLKTQLLEWRRPSFIADTYLISGVATRTNIMRGEETEAVGLLDGIGSTNLILLLPGTHCKHLHISNGILQDMHTYMTGELYAVLSQHSVLAASVATHSPIHTNAFFAGLDVARQQGVAGSLFHTRTRQVLGGHAPEENASFLSGLLIGSELVHLLAPNTPEIRLGGSPKLRDLYAKALDHFELRHWRAFSDAECQNSVVRGQQIILSHLLA
jgi:2-dehydro-3-deoxygalactonokinase